jgi:hypothetical protein
MGNHHVGRAMGRMADMALKMRTNQTAISLLDEICEPYRGADAEFEAEDPKNPGHQHPKYCRYTDPKGPLGILIKEAFDPTTDWLALQEQAEKTGDDDTIESFYESWGNGPEAKFDARYEFC